MWCSEHSHIVVIPPRSLSVRAHTHLSISFTSVSGSHRGVAWFPHKVKPVRASTGSTRGKEQPNPHHLYSSKPAGPDVLPCCLKTEHFAALEESQLQVNQYAQDISYMECIACINNYYNPWIDRSGLNFLQSRDSSST